MTFLRRRWPVIFLFLVPLLILWPAVFAGQAIGPWDHIRSMSPWNGPKPDTPWDVLQADGALQFAPWRFLVLDAWSHGQIPAWNNYQLMGTPLLANSQSAGFYPPHIFVGLLHIPLYAAMALLAWLHLFWAGLGVYLLTRRLGGTKTGGAIAGASFSLSAFMVYWTALPSVITTVSWIPWLIACILGFFQTDVLWGIAENPGFSSVSSSPADALREVESLRRSQRGWSIGVTISAAMLILAGHLQFVAFGLFAATAVALALTVKLLSSSHRRPIRIIQNVTGSDIKERQTEKTISRGPLLWLPGLLPLLRLALALAFAFCLAAPQLLPVLAFSKQSHRRSAPTAEGYAAYVSSAIQPFEWAGLEFPKMIGDPAESAGDPQNHSLFWPALIKRGDSFGESALAIGPLILLLLCCLPAAGWKRGLPVALVGILGILIACGTPFDWLLYNLVPGWSSTGSPGRAVVLFVLAGCCLGGLAIQPQTPKSQSKLIRGIALFIGITLLITVIAILTLGSLQSFIPGFGAVEALVSQARSIDMPMFLISTVLALAAIAAWLMKGEKAKSALLVAAAIVPVLLTLGILRFGQGIEPAKETTSFDRVAFVNRGWNLFVTPRADTPPNLSTLLRQHDVAGYDSLLDKDTKQLLDSANKQDSSPPENGNMMLIKPTVDLKALADLGVSKLQAPQQTINLPGNRAAIENAGPQQPITEYPQIIAETFMAIRVSAKGPGKLTLRDRNMPGWTATIDGKSTSIAPGPFRQIELPAGSHTVEFRYWPPGLTAGLVLFLLGLLPLVSSLLRWRGTQVPVTRN